MIQAEKTSAKAMRWAQAGSFRKEVIVELQSLSKMAFLNNKMAQA